MNRFIIDSQYISDSIRYYNIVKNQGYKDIIKAQNNEHLKNQTESTRSNLIAVLNSILLPFKEADLTPIFDEYDDLMGFDMNDLILNKLARKLNE